MALVVNGVCRFTVEGIFWDRPFVNILDMQLDTTGQLQARTDFIYDTAGNIINSWVEHVAPLVSNRCELERVRWVDLDQADGTTGERVSTSEHTLPVVGSKSGPPSPGNVAMLVTKQTNSQRGQRNGRWYQVGVTEDDTTGQTLGNTFQSTAQDAFSDFLDELNDTGSGDLLTRRAVVVHTTGDSPTTGTYSPVHDFVVQDRLATQRRRLRG